MSVTEARVQSSVEPWQLMPCELDDGQAWRAAIGLVTLCNDVSIEFELRAFLDLDGVCVYANRIPHAPGATVENLRKMEGRITEGAALIVPDSHLDVIAYGCTSGSMAIGPEVVAEKIRAARPGIATSDPVSAAVKGLRAFECRRIAVLNPYSDEVNQVVERFVTDQGFDIVVKGSFKQPGDPRIVRIPPEAIYEAGLEIGSAADAQALFISCTGLRVSPVLSRLEEALGKPVVSSNQALAWDCLRLAGCKEAVQGSGRLFTL